MRGILGLMPHRLPTINRVSSASTKRLASCTARCSVGSIWLRQAVPVSLIKGGMGGNQLRFGGVGMVRCPTPHRLGITS
jgi:hypothetical protein